MEVMSSLLLCVAILGALLPQPLVTGKQVVRSSGKDILFNNTLLIHQKGKHKLLLNLNGQPLVVKTSELHTVFNDYQCRKCLDCMKRAIKATKDSEIKPEVLNTVNTSSDMLANAIKTHRERRSTTKTVDEKRNKKGKRSKAIKSVTVTKYSTDGVIKGIKVKEAFIDGAAGNISCEVFSVVKSFPCATTEAELFLEEMKRTVKKKNVEKRASSSSVTGQQSKVKSKVVYRKRKDDNTQLPENIMPSVEDIY